MPSKDDLRALASEITYLSATFRSAEHLARWGKHEVTMPALAWHKIGNSVRRLKALLARPDAPADVEMER